jgi:hypothetical protein
MITNKQTGKDIRLKVKVLKETVEMLESLLCPSCNGKGGSWSRWDSYPDEWEECFICRGSGLIKENQ